MSTQTGPAAGQGMRRWLVVTGVTEIACAPLFAFVLWRISAGTGYPLGILSVGGLLTLDVVLIQGGLYWLLMARPVFGPFAGAQKLRFLRFVYAANVALLLIFPAVFAAVALPGGPPLRLADAAGGAFLYLFGVGEFVHYFVWKINMRPAEFRRALRERRPVPARIRRELGRARRRARSGPSPSAPANETSR